MGLDCGKDTYRFVGHNMTFLQFLGIGTVEIGMFVHFQT